MLGYHYGCIYQTKRGATLDFTVSKDNPKHYLKMYPFTRHPVSYYRKLKKYCVLQQNCKLLLEYHYGCIYQTKRGATLDFTVGKDNPKHYLKMYPFTRHPVSYYRKLMKSCVLQHNFNLLLGCHYGCIYQTKRGATLDFTVSKDNPKHYLKLYPFIRHPVSYYRKLKKSCVLQHNFKLLLGYLYGCIYQTKRGATLNFTVGKDNPKHYLKLLYPFIRHPVSYYRKLKKSCVLQHNFKLLIGYLYGCIYQTKRGATLYFTVGKDNPKHYLKMYPFTRHPVSYYRKLMKSCVLTTKF